MDEFHLIRRYFGSHPLTRDDVVLGIGDDAALFAVPAGHELAATVDAQLVDVHFPAGLDAAAVGHRALAVSMSDLAAMGAQPAWALLALTLPHADEEWLQKFSGGFFALAGRHDVTLAGGNMARGPMNITVTALGFVPAGKALTRGGAEPGDRIYVTGHPGDAAAGLKLIQSRKADIKDPCVQRFAFPEPRVGEGTALRGLASAAIDVSDGLLADLGHLLEASGAGASIEIEKLPLSKRLLELHGKDKGRELALTGGDDYELCFTVPETKAVAVEENLKKLKCPVTRIGRVDAMRGVRCRDEEGKEMTFAIPGYRHF
ncbi:MAG TPA: thiamine-phosphate kinase [Gammaproteobacteria bacterium]|nr:thiamine-phosphate kinase [Gammaproteobacteria bacterium]